MQCTSDCVLLSKAKWPIYGISEHRSFQYDHNIFLDVNTKAYLSYQGSSVSAVLRNAEILLKECAM